ncbi:MAG TPA: hypothetical protein EYN96_12475 [Candidatus Hydrogenedentes bacterium]|nr:hypothetical protein [Candidatus Hydrogenedentota bacterium]
MKLRIEETIATPVKQVFETLSNINISGIQKVEILSDTTEGEGHRWRETREMFGKEATEDMEITHYNPPLGYHVEASSHGMRYVTVMTFSEDGAEKNQSHAGIPCNAVDLGCQIDVTAHGRI